MVNNIGCGAPPAVTLLENDTVRTKVLVNRFSVTEFNMSMASVTEVDVVNPK